MATTHFLVDALTVVNILSLTFQKTLDLTIVQSSVNEALSALDSLKCVPGTHLAPFPDGIPEDAEDGGFTFQGRHIKDVDRQRVLLFFVKLATCFSKN